MASGQWRLAVVLLLLFMVASSMAVPTTRSFKTVKNQVSFGKVYSDQAVSVTNKNDGLLNMKAFVEGRMNLELADYTGTGANDRHDYP